MLLVYGGGGGGGAGVGVEGSRSDGVALGQDLKARWGPKET